MQITLIQAEIEQALKNYINDIMSVKEGMEIEIQLKATRGEEGTTAIIDIIPSKPKTAVRGSRVSGEAAGKSVSAVKAEPEPVKAVEPEPEPEVAVKAEPEVAVAEEAEAEPAEAAVEAEAEPVEPAPAEAAPRQSLFSGLQRPKNS